MKIHYLGPEGSFSERAAEALKKNLPHNTTSQAFPTVEFVARSVAENGGTLGVMPYYNFLEGVVQEHLDYIYEYELSVTGLIRLPIEFAVASAAGSSDRQTIYSHPKALAQVSDYLRKHYPDATQHPVSSTAEAARMVSEQKSGLAVASESALTKFGLKVIASDIGNVRHGRRNFTDFFIVSREPDTARPLPGTTSYTLLSITPPINRPGLLAEILGQFRFYNLNIEKIHSRPAPDIEMEGEPQMFYLEVKCRSTDDHFRRCTEAIEYHFREIAPQHRPCRILGEFQI